MNDRWAQAVAVWVCPQPDCEYQINRPAAGRDAEDFDRRVVARLSALHAAQRHEQGVRQSVVPGWEGSVGPSPAQYNDPHVYARNIHSGAGNCVCGWPVGHPLHVQAAPGVPVPDRMRP